MSLTLIAQLLATFGPAAVNLIDKLMALWQSGGSVTPDQWAQLRTAIQQSAQDRMRAQLLAAGIPLDSPQAIALLSLSSGT